MAASGLPGHSLHPPRCPLFAPISEHGSEEEEASSEISTPRRERSPAIIDFNKCRPSNLGWNSGYNISASMLKSLSTFHSPASSLPNPREESGEITTSTEFSKKLVRITKMRDEAQSEVSQLKMSVSELDKKLTRLDAYCQDIKFLVSETSSRRSRGGGAPSMERSFLHAISESRSMVQKLGQSLSVEISRYGSTGPVQRIGAVLLEQYNVRFSVTSRRDLSLYLEVLLNKVFYEDFETSGFQRNGSESNLDPWSGCQSNRAAYDVLKEFCWEEVKNHGTRNHSKEFSGFCDRKMTDMAVMLGWEKEWSNSKTLLQAFFEAAKWVLLLHLLSRSVHPAVPIFRVDKGRRFEPEYMEEMAVDQARQPVNIGSVRVMVAPGFYLHRSVIKCKVLL